jgi:Putative phage metallopeptidase
MGTTYELVNDDTHRLINRVLIEHHADLHRAGVTIQAMMASRIDKESGEIEQALKVRGYPCAAKIQITSYQDRVRGLPDVKLTIDEASWRELSVSRREALIDHELCHVMVAYDADGNVKRDDLGRPKLKSRAHDFELTWFTEVAERHGEAAIEVREVQRFMETYGQYSLFPMRGTVVKPPAVEAQA